jgi:nucleotide-binding universal stress UspA family protein
MRGEYRRVIGMYRRILAAIDGSPASADTLEQAVRLARELDVDLYTISVQEWPTPLEVIGREVEIPQALHDEFFDDCKHRIRSAAEEAGVRLKSTKVTKGIPATAILRYIEETGFDFVILGRRGRGFAHRLRWTSTAHKVIACANCPVLVCPTCPDETVRVSRDMPEASDVV